MNPSLQKRAHIDHHIPAADHVQTGERRILADVLLCENANVANHFADLIAAVRSLEERFRRSAETSMPMLSG
jgi:hypothetical protein